MYAKYEALDKCREVLKKQKLLHVDMTELIARGQAELVYHTGATVCLYDVASGIYFHTTDSEEHGKIGLEKIRKHAITHGIMDELEYLALHQDYMQDAAQAMFGMKTAMVCSQAVYTRKEKLPITGLYSMNEKSTDWPIQIRRLGREDFAEAAEHYEGVDGIDYLRERTEKGWLYGAYYEGKLAGFAGMHTEGSLGMLQVFPEYRRRKIGRALETYMINLTLELGHTPYGQVVEGNEKSMGLQEALGLCFAKSPVYWMHR